MIKERIIQYLEIKGISKYKFYQETGLSNGALDKIGSIGADKCEVIYSHYQDLNLEWLITGKGEMLKGEVEEVERIEDLKAHIADLRAENEFLKEQIRELNKKRPAQEDAECADAG